MDELFLDFDVIHLADTTAIAERCKGQNVQKTLAIFQVGEQEEELGAFLEKVLAAAQLNLTTDILSLILSPNENCSFIGLCQRFEIQTLLVFGINSERLGIHFQVVPYEFLRYEGRNYVFLDDLQLIYDERQQGGKRMSGELWKILKTLFLP